MSSKARERRRKRRVVAQASTTKRRTAGQTQASSELRDLVGRHPYVLSVEDLHAGKGEFRARIRIATHDMPSVGSGMPIALDHEDIELWFSDRYPNFPPTVLVTHDRFLGYPHVLLGRILCIYLDISREWHPALGAQGVVERLIEWFRDAAADRFDSRTALFHPIGGLPPGPRVAGTLVVREPTPTTRRSPIGRATVCARTTHRSDLIRWTAKRTDDPTTASSALVLRTTAAMPFGLIDVCTLGDLVTRVELAGGPTSRASLEAAARLLPHLTSETLRIIVEVAHPADPDLTYLASAVAPAPSSLARLPDVVSLLPNLPIGWTAVSDERPTVTTRRDAKRPTTAFHGKSVELWGCGGLGSWIAEFIARAGTKRLVLRDTGAVSGGLLVRQNYAENDVGFAKATQLAERLKAVADGLDVTGEPSSALDVLGDGYTPSVDVLIDATINVTVAARLDEWARHVERRPLLAQVATDPHSATLGLLAVADPDAGVGPATIDDATSSAVLADPTFQRFQGFWTPLPTSDQLVPAPGCSTPTFHGSAADLASLAGSLVSLLAGHIGVDASGVHLIEASHARGPQGGGHYFIPFAPAHAT